MSDSNREIDGHEWYRMGTALQMSQQLAHEFTRAREQLIRDAKRHSPDTAAQLHARLDVDRDTAGSRLAVVDHPDWWEHADVPQVASMYETARQWGVDDPRFTAALDTIRREIQNRYGVDPDRPSALREQVREAVTLTKLERHAAEPVTGTPTAETWARYIRAADGIGAEEQAAAVRLTADERMEQSPVTVTELRDQALDLTDTSDSLHDRIRALEREIDTTSSPDRRDELHEQIRDLINQMDRYEDYAADLYDVTLAALVGPTRAL